MPLSLSNSSLQFSIRHKIILGFGLALLMIGIIAIGAIRSTKAFSGAAKEAAYSLDLLMLQSQCQGRLIEAENEVRGYLVAGEESYLAAFEQACIRLAADRDGLRELAGKNEQQLSRIDQIEALMVRKEGLLKRTVETRRSEGADAASALIASREHFLTSATLRKLLEEFDRDEHLRLNVRLARTEAMAHSTTVAILLATVLTALLLISAGTMILKDITARYQAEEALTEEHHLLLSIMDAMPEQVYVTDLNGHCIINNAAHRDFLNSFNPGGQFEASEEEGNLIRKGALILNSEEPLIMETGEVKWLSCNKVPLKDTDGNVIGMVGVNSDISERKAADEKLRMAARQMARSNRDLQDFASVASHDLQEPLRKILAFGDRLRVKCDGALGENGRDYLERMSNAAERMQKLIQSLLTLSRVTSKAMPFEEIDLKTVAEEVVSDLEIRIEQTGAMIHIGKLPRLEADPQQIRQLFQNLISNALKFQKPGSKPEVSISGKVVEAVENPMNGTASRIKVCQIMVADNGIGFDQKFAERIFVVFQRLHGRLEYEGTGIGLAVCRRITERHGGTIQAKSEEGEGATFIVTLPVKQLIKEDNYETR